MKKLLLLFVSGVLLMSCSKNVEKKRSEVETWPLSEFNLQEGYLKDSVQVKLMYVTRPPQKKVPAGAPAEFGNIISSQGDYYVHFVGITVERQDTVNILSPIDKDLKQEDMGKVYTYLCSENKLTKILSKVKAVNTKDLTGNKDLINNNDSVKSTLDLERMRPVKYTKVIKPKDYDSSIFFRFPTVIGMLM